MINFGTVNLGMQDEPAPEVRYLPNPLGRRYMLVELETGDYGGPLENATVVPQDRANCVSSVLPGTKQHAPLIDLDVPHMLVPSSTPGHSHLYIDVATTWYRYKILLWALYKAGVIEQGFYRASVRRGYSTARLPWIRKDPAK